MRIATYNIWNSATGMPERKQQLIEEIIKISADIICLQEVPNKAAHQDLVERCRYQFAVFHKHANEEEGLSILSRYSIKSFEYYNEKGEILHFPVDNYYYEGKRTAMFLEEKVTKYHRTLTTYLNTLLSNSFIINQIVEPQPPENMMDIPGMADEMRRPMMLIVSAKKKM